MSDKESVKVIVRCRPMNQRENNLKCKSSVNVDSKRSQIILNKV